MKLCQHKEFMKGNVHTGFIPEFNSDLLSQKNISTDILAQAALTLILYDQNNTIVNTGHMSDPFNSCSGFRLNHNLSRKLKLMFGEQGMSRMIFSFNLFLFPFSYLSV